MRNRRRVKWIVGLAALLLVLALQIDDFSRDFTGNHAEVAADDPGRGELRPLTSERSLDELVVAVHWAARRIGGFEHVGDSFQDDAATVLFSKTSPFLRLEDDVMVTIVDRGSERRVTASSATRDPLPIGDLGRNPRNLRRLFTELRDVLDGAARNPAPFGRKVP